LYLTAVLRKEERKKERKEEGKMERWKDGKMERWKCINDISRTKIDINNQKLY
jgi:hypothetical protein